MSSSTQIRNKLSEDRSKLPEVSSEVMAVCPACKAFETLRFDGQKLVTTRKYYQVKDSIYHDCGTSLACKLFF